MADDVAAAVFGQGEVEVEVAFGVLTSGNALGTLGNRWHRRWPRNAVHPAVRAHRRVMTSPGTAMPGLNTASSSKRARSSGVNLSMEMSSVRATARLR